MNAFERHGIDHLSASAINLWLAAPSLFVMEKLLKRRGGVGCAAHRGSAVEAGVNAGLLDSDMKSDAAVAFALAAYDRLAALSTDTRREQEREGIEGMVTEALMELRAYGAPTPVQGRQHRIETTIEGVSVPFVGYLDWMFESVSPVVMDLKTTLKCPSAISDPHARQAAIYQAAKHNHEVRFLYATPKKRACYRLERDAYERAIEVVRLAAMRLERFLSVSNDAAELAAIVPHDSSSFYFSDATTKALAGEVFGY